MSEWKLASIVIIEILFASAIGLLLTIYTLGPSYEQLDITFQGNVWVIWFAVSIILFSITTITVSFYSVKYPLKKRLQTWMFWFLFVGAIVIIILPYFKGEVPY
ncbi:hypothetical protein QGM71_19765 [Virgibacillus sp. C22-A2]|uniref:Uncharacterized protein n=1 Tax=Virgibacillus tibetensis TaxID=3042313 RepID=A0ABU6KKG2_9BACI|nr:hypothetical protein [Virgibacillus sp. C22-A2]